MKTLAHSFTMKFINKRFLQAIDLVELIRSIRDDNNDRTQKIAEMYGLDKDY
jgi:hypothetical protein